MLHQHWAEAVGPPSGAGSWLSADAFVRGRMCTASAPAACTLHGAQQIHGGIKGLQTRGCRYGRRTTTELAVPPLLHSGHTLTQTNAVAQCSDYLVHCRGSSAPRCAVVELGVLLSTVPAVYILPLSLTATTACCDAIGMAPGSHLACAVQEAVSTGG